MTVNMHPAPRDALRMTHCSNSFPFRCSSVSLHFSSLRFAVNALILILSLIALVLHVESTEEDASKDLEDGTAEDDSDALPFCNLIVGGFDFKLTDSDASDLRLRSITTNVKKLLSEKQEEAEQVLMKKSWKITLRRVVGWIATLAVMVGTIFAVGQLIFNQAKVEAFITLYVSSQSVATLFIPLTVTFFKSLAPIIIKATVTFEQHKSDSHFRHMFGRVFLVRMFFVMTVIFQTLAQDAKVSRIVVAPGGNATVIVGTSTSGFATASGNGTVAAFADVDPDGCLETRVGKVFYRLVVFDFLVEILSASVLQYLAYSFRWFMLRFSADGEAILAKVAELKNFDDEDAARTAASLEEQARLDELADAEAEAKAEQERVADGGQRADDTATSTKVTKALAKAIRLAEMKRKREASAAQQKAKEDEQAHENVASHQRHMFSEQEIYRRELKFQVNQHREKVKSEFEVPPNLINIMYVNVAHLFSSMLSKLSSLMHRKDDLKTVIIPPVAPLSLSLPIHLCVDHDFSSDTPGSHDGCVCSQGSLCPDLSLHRYRQVLIWSGTPYCPVLPLVAAIMSWVLVFFKKVEVLNLTRLPDKPLAVDKQNRFFRSMLLLSLFISFAPFTYFFLSGSPSCGPFNPSHLPNCPTEQCGVYARSPPFPWHSLQIRITRSFKNVM
jgi:hypothetical protein